MSVLFRISFLVPDYDSGISFFEKILGFTVLQNIDISEGRRWVCVESPVNKLQVVITKAEGKQQEAAIGNQAGGAVGFFLETSDFHAEHSRLVSHGIEFLETSRSEPYGTVAVFRDPFGNKWDLIQLTK